MWMLHCDKVSKYVSDSMDRKLSIRQRLGVGMHLLMCRHCARFTKQLQLIRKLSRKQVDNYPQQQLDESVKTSIKKLLKKEYRS